MSRRKAVLDPCCGPRMFYFDKQNPDVLFCDLRHGVNKMINEKQHLIIDPDLVVDVTSLPFEDNSFPLVVLDPPHLIGSKAGIMVDCYGSLPNIPTAKAFLRNAFNECWRVLAPNGTLVFKWFEHKLSVREVIELAPCEPILGNKRLGPGKTHWLVFFKPTYSE